MAVLGFTCAIGCAAPRPITLPDVAELPSAYMAQGEQEGILLKATILPKQQARQLLGAPVAGRSVMPIFFAVTNNTVAPHLISRDQFSLQRGQLRIAPALPGRAAALLRNSSGSYGAALAGWLVFGIFAAPVIDVAEKQEAAAVEVNREIVFSEAHIPPGGTITGYLFFETPITFVKMQHLELGLRPVLDGAAAQIMVRVPNPYVKENLD
jgi:hypothetical protein